MKEKNYLKRRCLLLPGVVLLLTDCYFCASLTQLNRNQITDVVKTTNAGAGTPNQENHEFVDMTQMGDHISSL